MAIEYRLILAGRSPVEQVAERALPDPDERPAGPALPLVADLFDRYGFEVTVRASENGYFDAESDAGLWEWEPADYVAVTFRMDKDADDHHALLNMLTVVQRVLNSGAEDAALILNGNWLLLTRFHGGLVKHRRDAWWQHYPGADDQVPA
jgi:hypothetical protein